MTNEIFDWPTAKGLPIPYITAVWSGMDREALIAGLRAGSILAPPGSPKGWLPPDTSSASQQRETSNSPEGDSAVVPIDRAKVKGWFDALDSKLENKTFDSIWSGAGANDPERAQTLTSFLTGALIGKSTAWSDAPDGKQTMLASATAAALDAFLADPAHHATVVDLTKKTGTELAALAETDIGYRQALVAMQPLALVGNRALFAAQNADGHLDRFDPDSGESLLSDAWLGDRSKFLAWKNAQNAGKDLTIEGAQSWTFVDRGTRDAEGNPMTLELKSNSADATSNQVVFGNNESEVIKGQGGTDRIYGGGGDDVLRGGAGADHLEGGAGDDLVLGGAGNDELLGNQGADELDGGAGTDYLAGGSGDDILTGGRGNDRLDGGTGNDTYVIDAGDGTDTIVDADGVGSIVLDDSSVAGTMQRADDKWLSADGRLEFGYSGDAEEGGTLTIQAFAEDGDHTAAPTNVLSVKNWKNGDLGITLDGDLDGQSVVSGADPSVSANAAGEGALTTAAASVPVVTTASTDGSGGNTEGANGTGDATDSVDGADDSGGDAASDAVSGNDAASSFDFKRALDALFGSSAPSFTALDPGQVHDAIAAFSGVLEPPDVGQGIMGDTGDASAIVTTSHVADALASDVADLDFHSEMASAFPANAPELRPTAAIMQSSDEPLNALRTGASTHGR